MTTPSSQKTVRRNAWAFIGESAWFGLGLVFASTTTVLPEFVRQLTGSAVLIGLIISLTEGAWRAPQLLFANWLANKPRKKIYLTRAGLIGRPAYLLMALALFLGVAGRPAMAVALFFVLHTFMYFALSVDTLVWWDVLAKAIPANRRGRILGYSTALRGVISIGVGLLIAYLLGDSGPGFPTAYTICFAAGGACFMLSLGSWMFVVEPSEPVVEKRPTWSEYGKEIRTILRTSSAFRRLLTVRLLAGFNGLALGFFGLFAIDRLGFAPASLGLFAMVQTVSGILAGLWFARISERSGNHRIVQVATLISLTGPLVALIFLIAPDLLWTPLYSWTFVSIGVFQTAQFVGFASLNVDLAPPGQRATYVGLFNTLSSLVIIWPALGGWVLQQTSYEVLFALTTGWLVIAHIASWFLPSISALPEIDKRGKPPLL
ncbi:MAG: MFS transporter [Candidatus Atribacteria bacterium]|nr:MAG: MFS transporter [Candidatus Atribacteria bacterium]